MYKILIVDDEIKIRLLIRKYAEFEGYAVDEAANGKEALEKLGKQSFDIVILDIMMPELDGWQTANELRKLSNTPILFLSARAEEYDKIKGFTLGGDDYVTKPFSPKELMLRISAILKRAGKHDEPTKDIFKHGGLSVNFEAREVKIADKALELSPKEYDLLFYLVRNRGIALSREKLICEVWGYDFYGSDRTLDTHIKLLRKSLGEYSNCIVTLRGVGYRFDTK